MNSASCDDAGDLVWWRWASYVGVLVVRWGLRWPSIGVSA